jgi:rhodanese-related sulfurtransferase
LPVKVSRAELKRLIYEGAQLVEVLPEAEYDDEHLPGAVNIPLKELDASSAGRLTRDSPVIVYCNDFQ